jgi:hypothetical protein
MPLQGGANSSSLVLEEIMGSLLIITPAIFGLIFAFFMYKKINRIQLYRATRGQDDDDLLMRRMESVGDELESGANGGDQYRKLRQIYRDIQEGAKAFLAAEYRMCVYFLAAMGVFISIFVSRTDEYGFRLHRHDDRGLFQRSMHDECGER